jgi:hypothetical protein
MYRVCLYVVSYFSSHCIVVSGIWLIMLIRAMEIIVFLSLFWVGDAVENYET